MSRAWPFEEVTEAGGAPPPVDPREFTSRYGVEGTDAVLIRIGRSGWQLVLVAADGSWEKWVYPDQDAAGAAARAVGIEHIHRDHYPEDVRVRMNARRRSKAEFDRAAYQEQGRVGPVIPYPENRPRPAAGGGRRGGRREQV